MRLIDADEFRELIDGGYDLNFDDVPNTKKELLRMIDDAPTVDAVERKRGRWIHDGYDIPHGVDWMHCSVCGRREPHVPAAMTNFCPNCGADMRGEANDIHTN